MLFSSCIKTTFLWLVTIIICLKKLNYKQRASNEYSIWLSLKYIWCEWAKRICSPCPPGLCICVSRTSVFVRARHLYLLLGAWKGLTLIQRAATLSGFHTFTHPLYPLYPTLHADKYFWTWMQNIFPWHWQMLFNIWMQNTFPWQWHILLDR